MKVIELAGRRWALGLEWVTLDRPSPGSAEIKTHAQGFKANCYALRRQSAPQLGLGRFEGDKAPRAWALAANLADSEEEPWLGIFNLGRGADGKDLWWYIAVRDGQTVLPDGDVVGSYDEVRAARLRHEGLGRWQSVKEGGIPEVESLLALSPRLEGRLYATELHVPWREIAAVAVAAVLLVGGAVAWRAWKEHQAAEAARRAARARALLQAMHAREAPKVAEKVKPAVVPPWTNRPAPAALLARCREIFEMTPLSVGGWRLVDWSCGGGGWSGVYRRGPGASALAAPAGILSGDGNEVRQHGRIGRMPGDREGIFPAPEGLRALYGAGQALGGVVHAQERRRQQGQGLPGSNEKPPPPPPWIIYEVNLRFPVAPFDLGVYLDQVRGLRLDEVRTRIAGVSQSAGSGRQLGGTREWRLKGRLYVERKD